MKKKICLLLLGVVCLLMLGGCGSDSQQTDSDPLAGTSWIADNDGSQWVFRDDGSFSWYRDKTVTDDYYYAGDYTVHRGQAAVDYLVDGLSQYDGFAEMSRSREYIEQLISQQEQFDEDYNLNNFICFSCDNKSYMLDGQEQLSSEWITAYYGFILDEDNSLAIMNLRTGSYYGFSRETEE